MLQDHFYTCKANGLSFTLSMFDIPVLEARAHGGVRTIVAPDSLTVVNSEVIIFKCRNVFLL